MENFTPLASTLGGLLIGLAAALLLVANGRIAGISGIFNGILLPQKGEFSWRAAFVGGLFVGGVIMLAASPQLFTISIERAWPTVAVAGLLVGVGTRLGSGCTSGHGVCGLSRFSTRSLVATLSFMAAGAATVLLHNLLIGGA